jgi:hypothetical protein
MFWNGDIDVKQKCAILVQQRRKWGLDVGVDMCLFLGSESTFDELM